MSEYIYYIGLFVAVVSFLGFVIENTWLSITKGVIDNRNMNLPFLFGYGMAVVAFATLFGTPEQVSVLGFDLGLSRKASVALYYVLAFAAVCIGEQILGTLVEKLCGFEYWNYTWMPLHISKYTAVPTSLGFALAITVFMDQVAGPLMQFVMKMPKERAAVLGAILLVALSIDFVVSFKYMYQERKLYQKWRYYVHKEDNPAMEGRLLYLNK